MADTLATPRSYQLEWIGARPLTINTVARIHRFQWAQMTRETRRAWWALAKEARVPALDRVAIEITPLHANNKTPQDPGACAPAAKACVDGLVDAGVIADDTGAHVARITFLPPLVCGSDGMAVRITEVTDAVD